MNSYRFVTHWQVGAPIEQVWQALYHADLWPRWWRGVERVVELRPGDAVGLGSVYRYTWKGRLPYRLSFDIETTHIEPPVLLAGVASGDVAGNGLWQLASDGQLTQVRYDWQVRLMRPWMRRLAPLARPLFSWNHDVIMHWGAKGLAQRLGVAVAEQRGR